MTNKRGRESEEEANDEHYFFRSMTTTDGYEHGHHQHKRSRSIAYDQEQHTEHMERQRVAAAAGIRGANNKRQRDGYVVDQEQVMKRGRGISMTADSVDYGQVNIGQHRVSTPEVLRLSH